MVNRKWLAFLIPYLFFPQLVFAHNADQLPFLKVNGGEARIYSVGSTSLTDFKLPQDEALSNFLVNTAVRFELIPKNLPFLPETFAKLKLEWDFGDGEKSSDFNTQHTYKKTGSYIVQLSSSNPEEGVSWQMLDIVLVHIVPSLDYRLPQPVIKANDQQAKNIYTDILSFNFSEEIKLDASSSKQGTAPIKDYFWDLGDQTSDKGVSISRDYGNEWSYVAPILRVTDTNGFFVDTMVQLQNPDPITTPLPDLNPIQTLKQPAKWLYWLLGISIFVAISSLVSRLNPRKER